MPNLLRSVLAATVFTLITPAFGWVDVGHMVVAEIAWRRLTPKVKAECERLLAIGGDPRTNTFVTASCWADDTKTKISGPWHYTNYHFWDDGRIDMNQPKPDNVVTRISSFSEVLGDHSAQDLLRADALRYLIHFVGDIHQPLHATARDSEEHPLGDRGGNEFLIEPPARFSEMERPPKNLHSLWDFAGGLLNFKLERPLSAESQHVISRLADKVTSDWPEAKMPEVGSQNPTQWAKESFELSKSVVYTTPDGGVPSEGYLEICEKVSSARIANAGYRLAARLNRLLGTSKS